MRINRPISSSIPIMVRVRIRLQIMDWRCLWKGWYWAYMKVWMREAVWSLVASIVIESLIVLAYCRNMQEAQGPGHVYIRSKLSCLRKSKASHSLAFNQSRLIVNQSFSLFFSISPTQLDCIDPIYVVNYHNSKNTWFNISYFNENLTLTRRPWKPDRWCFFLLLLNSAYTVTLNSLFKCPLQRLETNWGNEERNTNMVFYPRLSVPACSVCMWKHFYST